MASVSAFSVLTKPMAGLMAVAALVAGCASTPANPEAVVLARATENWKALVGGNFDRAYQFTPPSYRAVTSLDDYKKGFGLAVKWTAAEPLSVKCATADKCVALVKIAAKLPLARNAPPVVNHVEQTWIREDGQWWVFPTP